MANKMRLIDIEQAKRATYEEVFWTESDQAVVRNFLAKLPKVDAVEVVHGEWKRTPTSQTLYCGVCDKIPECQIETDYCPNCGAKMDLKGEQTNG